MESIEEQPQPEVAPPNSCINCGSYLNVIPTKTPICEDCRTHFIKYPIPKWIKGFGIGIIAVLVFSLLSLSKNLQTGVHYKRGLNAEKHKNYFTAQKEFQLVVEKEPDYKEGQSHLLIAAFYNGDLERVRTAFQKLEHEEFDENDDLYRKVGSVLERFRIYLPADSFVPVLQKHNMQIDSIPSAEYISYLQKNPSDLYVASCYANFLQDQKRYREADSVLSLVLTADPAHKTALAIKIPLKREMNQLDSAYYYVNQMLAINHEDIFAMASKVRILLKEKKDDEALQLAKKCYEMDSRDAYSLCSLALVYHFKNDTKNRNAIMGALAKDSTTASALSYVNDVISGKEFFRN